ncbi:MAG: WD40-like repeat [Phycisphaerales bacterium]|nr:WD40-like repeat [Phycisphaerales bacterium]
MMKLIGLLLALAPYARADFSFVHITDSHVSGNDGEGGNAEKDAAGFREISALNPKPAFVAHTGDVCESATPREYAIWQRVLKELTIPIHVAPGNHDVRWNPLGKEGYRLGTGQPLYQSWDYENVHFVLLDPTVLLQHWGHSSKGELDWLKADLEKTGTQRPVVIGFHHWVGRDTVQVDNEEELLALVAPYNVRLWLQGHGHADLEWNINGAPAVMAKGLYQGSYHLIEVTKDTIKVKRRTLGKPSGSEILRDKSIPATTEVVWKDLFTVPLTRPAAVNWHAASEVEAGVVRITASVKDPGMKKIEYQLNGAKYAPMERDEDGIWSSSIPTPELTPGEQQVTVRLTLADGREYQQQAPALVAADVTPAWTANAGGAIQSHLVRAGDALYVTTMGNDLVVLDPASRKERWRFAAEDSIFSTPVVDGGVVYFGSADHFVYAVDTQTHKAKWKTKTDGAVFAGPAVAKGVVCIGSVDQNVYGLDAASGAVRWTVKGGGMYQSNTATDGERFFVGGWDNTFRAIDAATGKVAWERRIGKDKNGKIQFYYSPAISSPAVGEGKVFVTTNDGVLHAFDTVSGEVAWEFDGKRVGYSSPLFHEGKVYCAIGDERKVFCWDAKDGTKIWESKVIGVIYDSSFVFAGGRVFIGSVDGAFNAIEADTGKVAWRYRLGMGHVFASPAADGERVYIGSLSGRVTALPVK